MELNVNGNCHAIAGCTVGNNGVVPKAVCKHCFRPHSGKRPRGLCNTCYLDGDTRRLHPVITEGPGRRGEGQECPKGDRKNWKPTNALPGTREKIRVMRDRVEKDLPIFHPLDATWNDMVAGSA